MTLLFVLHLLGCAFMTGVIWIIQLIHYPAFRNIHTDAFNNFHNAHTRALGFIAGPVMVLELVTGVLILEWKEPLTWINAALIVALWGLTFLVAVPLHNKLAKGLDTQTVDTLISTNWYRTGLWSVRCVLLVALI